MKELGFHASFPISKSARCGWCGTQCRWRWCGGRLERKRWCRRQKKKPDRTIVTAFGWLGVTTNDAVFEVLIMGGKRTVSTVSHNRCFTSQTFSFTIAVCDLRLATLFFKRFSNLAMYRLPFLGAVFFCFDKSWNSKTGTSRGLREDIPTTFETNRLQVCHPGNRSVGRSSQKEFRSKIHLPPGPGWKKLQGRTGTR